MSSVVSDCEECFYLYRIAFHAVLDTTFSMPVSMPRSKNCLEIVDDFRALLRMRYHQTWYVRRGAKKNPDNVGLGRAVTHRERRSLHGIDDSREVISSAKREGV